MADIISLIKDPKRKLNRKVYIKRRAGAAFEDTWQDITKYVKKWGKISTSVDAERFNRFKFSNAQITVENNDGLFNPHTDDASLWNSYSNQQRTLVKIEAGFLVSEKSSRGIWNNLYLPGTLWDQSYWDTTNSWDSDSTSFTGIISGDIILSDQNQVMFTIKPLNQVFLDYSAENLRGYNDSITASDFCTLVRDHTDGSGSFVFRPFFGNTTTYWDISTTTNILQSLNTHTSKDVIGKSVWSIIEKLAEAENFLPYVTKNGTFKFVSRNSVDASVAYEFHGVGSFDSQYGTTIKKINSYGQKISKYYSRVLVKYRQEDTSTSYEATQSSLVVSSSNNPWQLGERVFQIDNNFIATATSAQAICQTVFTEVSALKNEIDFTTSFVPHLDILTRISISYDSATLVRSSLWDQNNWAEDVTSSATDLIWDSSRGDAIRLVDSEFKFLSIEMDLDNFECKFVAREI